ncbi:F-actin-capping protein subunit beta [Geodia barretti]|uniref:F-actin-capping protein subunit beta n=1 Tax=Geodia barretti TaxID=519541 RepID=A0AA35VX99_GEOBA|nr:F-actin-capping protein subunit beta [Geodia barretti]
MTLCMYVGRKTVLFVCIIYVQGVLYMLYLWREWRVGRKGNSVESESSSQYTAVLSLPHRSPWSNKYDPPLSDGAVPSDRLQRLEIEANQAFDTYRELYFESGVCSVYLWDLDHGFAGVILIKKAGDTEKIKGCWDSIHVVEVQERHRVETPTTS